MRNKVFYPAGDELSIRQIIKESGFLGISEKEMTERISGTHCNCGDGKGEFTLLPLDSLEVIEGGKRYTVCRNCGCYSHL